MNALHKEPLFSEKTSFLINACRLPDFDLGYHCHNAFEIIWFITGSGLATIDNAACSFQAGDIFMLGSNLAHQFQPTENAEVEAIIIHFRDDCWGKCFWQIPECQSINKLLQTASAGLKLKDDLGVQLQSLIKSLELAVEVYRVSLLLQCLQLIASSNDLIPIAPLDIIKLKKSNSDCIENIFNYTNHTFRDAVTLPQIASFACMSVPKFCNYFKRHTNKTYITYLNEIRIRYACQQLLNTCKSVTDIGYESGFNTVAHFHRQFLRLKNSTPLQYRKTNGEK